MKREMLKRFVPVLALLALLAAFASPQRAEGKAAPVKLHWLDRSPPPTTQGVAWGVPWPQHAVDKSATFRLTDANGQALPLQSWTLAYWPDGSIKWTGFATTGTPAEAGMLTLSEGLPEALKTPLKVTQSDEAIEIANGPVVWRLPKRGASLVESVSIAGKAVARDGKLICMLEDRSQYETNRTIREEDFTSQIDSVALEQTGPERAVVKIDGKHKSDTSDRAFLPFTVRLYFYAGSDSIRMVHTFIFDGDQEKDFIKALGIRFSVPLREQVHNRHVRLAGDDGMFAEPVRLIAGRRNPDPAMYARQIAGQRVPNLEDLPDKALIAEMPVWDAYRLVQISDGSWSIEKRTNPQSAWIHAASGSHSMGTAFFGDVSGGLAVGLKNFWQLAPTELEVRKASTDSAELTAWLWSPESPAMDLRHYDVKAHGLDATYEDVQPGFSTATGIARTSEVTICPFGGVPSDEELVKLARTNAQTPLLVCDPAYYHSIPAFGIWSLPDRSTPAKRWIEDQLDAAVAFYQGQIQQRHWYGFWDFGDFMHSYDATRHEWKYDVGGFAWANTELMPNLWLWYTFLRSGRPDVYRMAEAMTRQSQEVDVYHLGRFAGLGSRHNVRHWGDGAKEVRISQALLKRPYYYLTTDERTGDLMNEVINVDRKLVDVDPLREIEPKSKYPTHVRLGPDWFALAGNWFTAWERTGDTKYRDKIVTGMKAFAAMPRKLFSGDSYGYDPQTGMVYSLHDRAGVPSLAALFGGPELMFEIDPLVDVPEWNDAFLQYCQYLDAPRDVQKKVLGGVVNTGRGGDFARMAAYAAYKEKDAQLAARAWDQFLHPGRRTTMDRFDSRKIGGPEVPTPVDEIPDVSTNSTSQWCLNAIELLQMIGDELPPDAVMPSHPEEKPR